MRHTGLRDHGSSVTRLPTGTLHTAKRIHQLHLAPSASPDESICLQHAHQARILSLDVPQKLLVPGVMGQGWVDRRKLRLSSLLL